MWKMVEPPRRNPTIFRCEQIENMIPHESTNNVSTSGIQLFANFDSGNMLRYERVTSSMSSSQVPSNTNENHDPSNGNASNNHPNNEPTSNSISHPQPKHDVEFNVWTRRDCEGTGKVNSNRSWFYFGVKGGHGKCIRFNIMNLNRQARLFEMGMLPVFRTVPGHEKWSRLYIRPCWETVNEDFKLSFVHRMSDMKNSITYFAFCFPHSYEDMQNLLNTYDTLHSSELADHYLEQNLLPVNSSDIYYHRETLCYSCDGNKVDLLTITSYKGICKEREHHFDRRLFPDAPATTKRPHQFRNKRVFFLSSRVHPGETPAAFVFLGFLDFILKTDDPRAKLLRDLYVFKLIPILNPDGVQRGHYRTDQFGVNLNRMYLDPDFERHPSIYAAKSLIAYHHINNSTLHRPPLTVEEVFKDQMPAEQLIPVIPDNEPLSHHNQIQGKMTPRLGHFSSELRSESVIKGATRTSHRSFEASALDERCISEENRPFFLERKENGLISRTSTHLDQNDDLQHTSPYVFHYFNENFELHRDFFLRDNPDDEEQFENQIKGNEGSDDEDDFSTLPNENGTSEAKSPHLSHPDFLKISSHESGVAYYLDLHGHASKKGCFIYGNHLPDDEQHTDNILYPKLISMNSPHFDFENCNFTIKNMYMKDKREGLSKEGSGRVALNKHFGILHSYTLECSYAVGKSCNPIPAAESETHGGRISPATSFSLPPKFTIEHYRDVGKACALAAIDIIPGHNPFTRVAQSSFKTLNTLREFLKHQVRQQRNRTGNARTTASNSGTTASTSNRTKQQMYLTRVTNTYRTTTNANSLNTVTQQQQQMTAGFQSTSSAPAAMAPSRLTSNSQTSRGPVNQQNSSSRLRSTYENRRYSQINSSGKRPGPQTSLTPNPRSVPVLSRIEMAPLPPSTLGLQHQMSSPGRLQRPTAHALGQNQMVVPTATFISDGLTNNRSRAAPLPSAHVRNAIHRNAVSLNALSTANSTGTINRGRSQNSSNRTSLATRTARLRQQSVAAFELQHSAATAAAGPYGSTTLIFRNNPLHADPPPVFFE